MKLTKETLKRIIKEELNRVMETMYSPSPIIDQALADPNVDEKIKDLLSNEDEEMKRHGLFLLSMENPEYDTDGAIDHVELSSKEYGSKFNLMSNRMHTLISMATQGDRLFGVGDNPDDKSHFSLTHYNPSKLQQAADYLLATGDFVKASDVQEDPYGYAIEMHYLDKQPSGSDSVVEIANAVFNAKDQAEIKQLVQQTAEQENQNPGFFKELSSYMQETIMPKGTAPNRKDPRYQNYIKFITKYPFSSNKFF